MANQSYNFKYVPLTGKLPGASMVQQTEQAINELAQIVNEGSAQVEVINNLVNQANDNAAEALTKATEALETSGRVYITLPNIDDADSYYDSQLYYFANKNSSNLPVADTGFLEVKTNDTKTSAEQVFVAETSGTVYVRHGVISSDIVGEETVYSVLWDSWILQANENYVSEEIRQHGNVPVGFEYFSMNPNVPQGSLPLLGGEYDRSTYSDLWEWVQQQTGYLKTEAEWQALSTANNGNVPYYSSGDGSTTFRVPSLRCWVKGTDGSAQLVGSYLEAGLPNITGIFGISPDNANSAIVKYTNGSFYSGSESSAYEYARSSTIIREVSVRAYFDASRSSAIYGNSTTVQPESIVGMWLVKAYGTIVDTGQIDEQAYIDDRFNAAKQYTDTEISDAVSAINTRLGTVLTASGTSTITSTETSLCSITTHPAGTWLIIGFVTLSYSGTNVYNNKIKTENHGGSETRNTATNGGGNTNVLLTELDENEVVSLTGYQTQAGTMRGNLKMVQLA